MREHGVVGITGPPLFSVSIQVFMVSCGVRSGLPENVSPFAQSEVLAAVTSSPTVLFEQRSNAFGSTKP